MIRSEKKEIPGHIDGIYLGFQNDLINEGYNGEYIGNGIVGSIEK